MLNSTSLVETLNLNIPTILIFSKDEKFSNIGTKVFKKLKKANIFLTIPKEAYKFVNKYMEQQSGNFTGGIQAKFKKLQDILI